MLRKNLLLTTAFIVAGSLSFAAAAPATRPVRPDISAIAGRDANAEFLCTYGAISVSAYEHSSSDYSKWTHAAVPITGHGQTVSTIIVKEAASVYEVSQSFSASIYTSNKKGFPSRRMAAGVGKATQTCRTVTINIPPTKLKRNKLYWIEERETVSAWAAYGLVEWAIDPRTSRRAYSQFHVQYQNPSSSVNSTTPWTALEGAPYFRLK